MSDLLSLYTDNSALSQRTAISSVDSEVSISYKRLSQYVMQTGIELKELGLKPGDRVVTVLPNGTLSALSFLACSPWTAFAPLNPAYTEDEFSFYLDDLQPSLILLQRGEDSPVQACAEKRGIPISYIEIAPGRSLFDNLVEGDLRPPSGDPEETALILHTSGTTSRPKMVPLSQRNLIASANNIANTLALTAEDRCLNVMPLFHIHGLMAPILATVVAKAQVACSPGLQCTKVFRLVRSGQTNLVQCCPYDASGNTVKVSAK